MAGEDREREFLQDLGIIMPTRIQEVIDREEGMTRYWYWKVLYVCKPTFKLLKLFHLFFHLFVYDWSGLLASTMYFHYTYVPE
jgi:hypothetical protein